MNRILRIGNKEFDLNLRTYIMGILNVTPDSFSDGGRFTDIDAALRHAEEMIQQGADIIDVGGESTRPNHTPLGEEEETERVIPIVRALKEHFDVPVSIDTYKSMVAENAVQEGAALINDVWGFKKDPRMAEVAARLMVPCCLMHNRNNMEYSSLVEDVIMDLKESVEVALKAGVKPENIILDPGFGFAKSYTDNLNLMNRLEALKVLGYPLLLGTSRKSMIGNTLNLPPQERVEGTIATSVIGIMKGCDFIRVHDVLENKRACMMTDAIVRR